jgi:hypothetical protein
MKVGGIKVLSEYLGSAKQLREQKYLIRLVHFLIAKHRKK